MRIIFFILFFYNTCYAGTYYFSATGNDANSGTSPSAAWRTIAKFNSSFTSRVPGDHILFNRGDVFYGSLIISRSGSSGNPIIIGAYGTGPNPVITGFTTVSAWTDLGSNIWESTGVVSALNDMNCVVINNVNTPMGRYPNTGYFATESHVGTTSITSSNITGTPNWTGADVVMRTWNFAIARNLITSQSGSTLTYRHTTVDNGHDGYGFFIENDARTLDTQNEWYYNPATKKLRIYSNSMPAKVQASTADTLVYMVSKSYLTFEDIDFTGSNRRAFYVGSCAGITIQNCNFDNHGLYVVWGGNNHGSPSTNFNFNRNTVNHINSQAIVLQNEFTNAYIGYNTFNNCGVLPGMFKVPSFAGSAQWYGAYGTIYTSKTNGLVVEYNLIDSTGYTGIHFTGNNTRINNNEVSHHCMLLMDGGGIYTWTGPSGTPTTGSKIYNNIVHDGYGNNEGTTEPNRLCQGLYLDENTRNTEVYNNSLFSNPYGGIFSNANTNCNIHDNVCYDNTLNQILFSNNYNQSTEAERLNIVKHNIFFSRTATQYVAKFSTKTNDIPQFFSVCDSNYYCRPVDPNKIFYTNINNASWGYYNLAQWQSYIGVHDANSRTSPKTVTNVSDIRIEFNATGITKTITLDGNYIDVKNLSHNGSITLAPYTSAVLIRSGPATNKPPAANAGPDQTILLP